MNLSYEEYQKIYNPKIEEVQHITPSQSDAEKILNLSNSLSLFIQKEEKEDYETTSESSINSSDIEIIELGYPDNKVLNKYDSKKYIQTFLNKNATKVKEKITCDICCGSYTYFNKSKHIRSKKHLLLVEKYHK